MPVDIVKKHVCTCCGATFDEREHFPGLKVCELCDGLGKSGVLYRGKEKVFAGGKRGL